MGLSKKTRFEVFKRDGFRCAYCGQSPPAVVLEVDHIEAQSTGGSDDINNLVTACFDCNRGKTNIPLSSIPSQISENLQALKEREEQLKEYQKYVKKTEARINSGIKKVQKMYEDQYEGWTFTETFKLSIKYFFKFLTVDEIKESMVIAIGKFPADKNNVQKYFCGICWTKIKSRGGIR